MVEWTAEVYFPDALVMSSDSDEAASAKGGIISEVCGLSLASVKLALQHMMEVHLEERPFTCPNANEGYEWGFKRKSHHLPVCRHRKVTLFLCFSVLLIRPVLYMILPPKSILKKTLFFTQSAVVHSKAAHRFDW